jgi:N-methylhydantoinase A/oxoprolinase/acetone carboxylase beta subunit
MYSEYALRYPILTIACGPTNSIRGAAHLSGLNDALVVDIGGTTTDIGVLMQGFPRQSSAAVEIGGIRTNFRMPDILSIGIGGGTIVRLDARSHAIEQAVLAGADRDTVQIVLFEDIPIAYLPGNALLVKVKAAGRL